MSRADIQADKEAILTAFSPGEWLGKAEILAATGLEKISYALDRLITEKKLIARGSTTSRQWALPGTPGTPRARAPAPAEDLPVAEPAEAPDPEDFIPAMATDRRMVLVRKGAVMILSAAETQAVADLIFENFEAAT